MIKAIEFGTDGIRGKAESELFARPTLLRLSTAIAQWAQNKYCTPAIKIALAHDTRYSNERIKIDISDGLIQKGIHIADAGILPTPGLITMLAHKNEYHCGIIISASHNPWMDNGIKLIDNKSGKLTPADEQTIATLFYEQTDVPALQAPTGTREKWHNAVKEYEKQIIALFPDNFLTGTKIALDCAQGATYSCAPTIFTALGAEVIPLCTTPTGYNINKECGAVNPKALTDCVQKNNAAIGFAFDGDGDRVVAVNRHGKLKDGDDLLALLLQHPAYQNMKTVVGTSMTNLGFEHYLEQQNITLVRTKVGDKYIAQALERKQLLIGGETSGHIILRDYLCSGDGIVTALRIMESVLRTGNNELKTFEKYPQVLINVPVEQKWNLASPPLAKIITSHRTQLAKGRIVIRYSGTENVLRIMTEDKNYHHAHTTAHTLATELQSHFH